MATDGLRTAQQIDAGLNRHEQAMKIIVHKPRSLGSSSVAAIQSTLQLGHFLFEVRELPSRLIRKGYLAVLIGEIALVEYFKTAVAEVQETNHMLVTHERLADVIDLSANVLAFGIRQKDDAREVERPWADINDLPVWSLPNGMELCFDVDAGNLPDRPARQLVATMGSNLLWNNRETFVEWLTQQGEALRHINTTSGNH